MKCEIDIIMNRKQRWAFKDILSKKGIVFKEWFVEFNNEKSIISLEIEKDERELLKNVFDFLKDSELGVRIVLPDGYRINPFKEDFDKFYSLVCEYLVKE